MDRQLAARAAEAIERADRFGLGPIPQHIVDAINRALAGIADPSPTCPDRDHRANVLSLPDDHVHDHD